MRRWLLFLALVAPLIAFTALAYYGQAIEGHAYPQEARRAFEADCLHGGGSDALCRCLLRGMQRRYTYAQFEAMAREDIASRPEYAAVARDCAAP